MDNRNNKLGEGTPTPWELTATRSDLDPLFFHTAEDGSFEYVGYLVATQFMRQRSQDEAGRFEADLYRILHSVNACGKIRLEALASGLLQEVLDFLETLSGGTNEFNWRAGELFEKLTGRKPKL